MNYFLYSSRQANRPEERVPEHASSKAVTSASTPDLGDGAVIWSAPDSAELWIAPKPELVNYAS